MISVNYDLDFFVVGAGSGGVRAARIAAGYGATTKIAESFRVGGTCVIRGCVPKKLLVYASRFADDFADARGFGWNVGAPTFDWPTLVAAKEKEISRLSEIYRQNLARANVEILESRARLLSPHRVRLDDGREFSAKHILISTGAAPVFPQDVGGVEHAISSNEVFDLPKFPQRILIVGGGYIAVEFACLFARLGAQTTLAFRASNVLRGFDEDIRNALRDRMTEAGVRLCSGRLPKHITREGEVRRVVMGDEETIDCDQVLIATGRAPMTAGLGLDKVGVHLGERGEILADVHATTNIPSIHAVGDVVDLINLTPVAIRQGHVLADRLFGGGTAIADLTGVATGVFTTPEIGVVGLTEEGAVEVTRVVDVYKAEFRPMKATLSGSRERALLKLVVDGESDRLLGAHVMGPDAGEIIQILAIALKMGAKKADLDATMAVHPTLAEELVTMRSRTRRREGRP